MNLPTNLPALLREAGLTVEEESGWRTRGHFDFSPVGVLNHHIGASAKRWSLAQMRSYARWMFRIGRSDLAAPICNLTIYPNGTVRIGAARASYHGGTAKASGSVGAGNANRLYIGIEVMLSGTEVIPAEQMRSMVKTNAVLTEKVTKTSVNTISCHYNTSVTGKWDIGDPQGVPFKGTRVLDIGKFRNAVAVERDRIYRPAPPRPVTLPDHWDADWAVINAKPHWLNPTGRAVAQVRAAAASGASIVIFQELTARAAKAIAKMPGWNCDIARANDRLPIKGTVHNGIAYRTSVYERYGSVHSEPRRARIQRGTKRGGPKGKPIDKTFYACVIRLRHRRYNFLLSVGADHVPARFNAVGDTRANYVRAQREKIGEWVRLGWPFLFGEDGNGTTPTVKGASLQGALKVQRMMSNGRRRMNVRSLRLNDKRRLSDHPGMRGRTRFLRAQMRATRLSD